MSVSSGSSISTHNFPQYRQTSFQIQLEPVPRATSVIKADPILTALSIPSEFRTAQDLAPIIDFVKGLKFFHSFSFYPETVAQIAAKLELHSFINGSHIFHEGEVGNHFYVILDGEISIYKRKRLASANTISENVLLVKLGCGQHFGETALESKDGLRTASAIATKNSNLLVLYREDYLSILSQFKVLLKVAVRRSLQTATSIFSHLPEQTLTTLSEVAVVRSFAPNSIIFLSGTRISSLMIVKSGLVKLIKPLSKQDYEEAIRDSEKKVKAIRNAVLNPPPVSPNRSHRVLRSQSALNKSTNKSMTGPLLSAEDEEITPFAFRRRQLNETIIKETPPGHWILTRSEDYVARNKLHASIRDLSSAPGAATVNEALGSGSGYVRRLSFSAHNNSNSPHRNLSISPLKQIAEQAQQVQRYASSEQVEFTMGVLMSGDVLGEVALLDAEGISPITALASTAVDVYCIDVEVLIELGIPRDEKIMRSLLDDWKFRNPPPTEIRKKYQVKYEWEIQKKAILQDIASKKRVFRK